MHRVFHVNRKRVRKLNDTEIKKGPVVYWMSRDQRVNNNWALLYAQQLSLENDVPLFVVFTIVDNFPGAYHRHFHFMLEGLKEVEHGLKSLNIPFILLLGDPRDVMRPFIYDMKIGAVVTDFDPVQIKRQWKHFLAGKNDVAYFEVDAHNIVPAWVVSDKEEYSAATFRRKIGKLFNDFIDPFPQVLPQTNNPFEHHQVQWDAIEPHFKYDRSVEPVNWIKPGSKAAWLQFNSFLADKLSGYDKLKNDPNSNAQSDMSPYLHFGQISAQAMAIKMIKELPEDENRKAFLEQLIVRRELSDNYCFYNSNYNNIEGIKNWAKTTLNKHIADTREFIYTLPKFEHANTYDALWNAAQKELVTTGKMHGYMRMYWAKKILEWSSNPKEAFETAIYLNDKYSLDGRDPNGYVGVAWSIGGVHDRPWAERPIFGNIRYMNYNGCKRKFDIHKYITTVNQK